MKAQWLGLAFLMGFTFATILLVTLWNAVTGETLHFDFNQPPTEHWSPPTQPEELEA